MHSVGVRLSANFSGSECCRVRVGAGLRRGGRINLIDS